MWVLILHIVCIEHGFHLTSMNPVERGEWFLLFGNEIRKIKYFKAHLHWPLKYARMSNNCQPYSYVNKKLYCHTPPPKKKSPLTQVFYDRNLKPSTTLDSFGEWKPLYNNIFFEVLNMKFARHNWGMTFVNFLFPSNSSVHLSVCLSSVHS